MRTSARVDRGVSGITLIELVIALAIAGLLVGIAMPNYGDWIAEYQMMNFARDLAGNMNTARSEAIKRGIRVNVCKSANRRQCAAGGDWAQGFVVYVDVDHDGQIDAGESALRVGEPAPPRITATRQPTNRRLRVLHKHGHRAIAEWRVADGHAHRVPQRAESGRYRLRPQRTRANPEDRYDVPLNRTRCARRRRGTTLAS